MGVVPRSHLTSNFARIAPSLSDAFANSKPTVANDTLELSREAISWGTIILVVGITPLFEVFFCRRLILRIARPSFLLFSNLICRHTTAAFVGSNPNRFASRVRVESLKKRMLASSPPDKSCRTITSQALLSSSIFLSEAFASLSTTSGAMTRPSRPAVMDEMLDLDLLLFPPFTSGTFWGMKLTSIRLDAGATATFSFDLALWIEDSSLDESPLDKSSSLLDEDPSSDDSLSSLLATTVGRGGLSTMGFEIT
mmetsp:Transcript_9757/g.14676  ORF Transcript_9757/g.14676 Transcript_9757/m.14676 type:complete len:253 (-) Transcript_9757:536-1294(-)